MAIVPTLLTQGGSDVDGSSYATAPDVAPTTGKTVLASILAYDVTGNLSSGTVTCTGCGLTWSLETAPGSTTVELFTFSAIAIEPTVGAVTFAGLVSSGTAEGAVWQIVEIDNTDVVAGPRSIIQKASGSTTTDALTVTLPGAFRDAESGTVGVFGAYDNAGGVLDITEGTGFTMLSELSQVADGDTLRIGFQWRPDNDTTVDATVSAANDRLSGAAFEIGHWKRRRSSGLVVPPYAAHRAAAW